MKIKFTIVFFFFLAGFCRAQKVGLVFSGGAAKGIAHIGVLKALEENEIPIDYLTGTSMGGIVAGCYAAGMSPEQIEEIFLSKEFLVWVNGKIGEGNRYYFYKKDDEAAFLKLNLSLDSTLNIILNTSLANDLSLNFALAEKLAQPSAISGNNFDSLFVPLRVVASDIFTQTQVIIDKGVLSDALRATQTVPFFYNPIKFDGKYLFDGGVYNNFPVDVMQKSFHPEVVIGSNVSSKVYEKYPYSEDEKLISRALLYMLLDKSDPTEIPKNGVYIQPNLKKYSAFDFGLAKALIDSGYEATIRQMPEIKSKISERRSCEVVAAARNKFNNRTMPLKVSRISFNGFDSHQQKYLNRFFNNGKRPLYLHDIHTAYYKLVSEDYFNNVYPSFNFDPKTKDFDFNLAKRHHNNFQVDFGGVIATRNVSDIYLSLNYYYFNKALTHTQVNFFTGDFYKSANIKTRIDFPFLGRFYIEPEATFNNWSFLQGKDIIAKKFSPTVLDRIDRKIGVNIGFPVGHQYKLVFHGEYINNNDEYIDHDVLVSSDTLDVLKLSGWRTGIRLSSNTLNRKQYSNLGRSYRFSVDWFNLSEDFKAGNTSILKGETRESRSWLQARVTMEEYFSRGIYSSGYYFDAVLSTQPLFSNYFGTIINAPAFNPLQDSRTLLLTKFRAFNYVAGGWRNVFTLKKSLDFRLEGYLFKPLQQIERLSNQQAQFDDTITRLYFAGTAGIVLHSTVGPVSLSLNYYDDKNRQLAILLHVGFLLFNKSSME